MRIIDSNVCYKASAKSLFGVLLVCLLIFSSQHAFAGDGKAFYTFEGTVTKAGTVKFTLAGNDTVPIAGVNLELTQGQTALQVANALKTKFEDNDWTNVFNGFTFTVQGVPASGPTQYILLATPNQNPFDKTFTQLRSIGLWNLTATKGLKMSSGQDPVYGMVQWDVVESGDPFEGGDITIGIAGTAVSTSTDGKDALMIKDDLVLGLQSAGFGSAYIDSETGYITLPWVELGDPIATDGVDIGAEFETTDGGFGGLALVTVPEPTTAALIGFAAIMGCIHIRRRR